MDKEYYFYGYVGDGELEVLPDLKGVYVGKVVGVDDHFYDEGVNAKSVHAFRVMLDGHVISTLDLVYMGSLEVLM